MLRSVALPLGSMYKVPSRLLQWGQHWLEGKRSYWEINSVWHSLITACRHLSFTQTYLIHATLEVWKTFPEDGSFYKWPSYTNWKYVCVQDLGHKTAA
jgi:hypothetical protein